MVVRLKKSDNPIVFQKPLGRAGVPAVFVYGAAEDEFRTGKPIAAAQRIV